MIHSRISLRKVYIAGWNSNYLYILVCTHMFRFKSDIQTIWKRVSRDTSTLASHAFTAITSLLQYEYPLARYLENILYA